MDRDQEAELLRFMGRIDERTENTQRTLCDHGKQLLDLHGQVADIRQRVTEDIAQKADRKELHGLRKEIRHTRFAMYGWNGILTILASALGIKRG